ncbi:MAG: acyltransferase [Candidatus Competibacter sp.]|nr:acyltransferase [Candidatus Competibacter sp.]MDG4584062.1 acyltransferase [Candidatus Competibacter sp.]
MTERNYGLDVLRAVAILLVLASHAIFFIIQAIPESNIIKLISYFCGFWGVELFFVLSGFLIGTIIKKLVVANSRYWIFSFWIRRWFRTLPCYFLFLLLNVLWFYYLSGALPKGLYYYPIFSQNLAWAHPDFFPEAWSLSVEEYFYLVFPLIITILIRCKIKPENSYLYSGAFLLIFSTALRFYYAFVEPSLVWDADIRKVVVFRFDSLMSGIYLSWFIDHIHSANLKKNLFLLGLSALSVSMVAYFSLDHDRSYFLKTIEFSITAIGFALIIPCMLDFRLAKKNIVGVFFKKTALWSYSIYLSNFLLYTLTQKFIFSEYFSENKWDGVLLCIPVLIFSCYLVSATVYRAYELPVMNLREHIVTWISYRIKATDRCKV